MSLKQALELIPADSLYYSKIEKGWRFFSDEQFEKIIEQLTKEDIDIDGIMIFIEQAQEARKFTLLLDRFLNDEITFTVNKDGMIEWATK